MSDELIRRELEARERARGRAAADRSPLELATDLEREYPDDAIIRRRLAAGATPEAIVAELAPRSSLVWWYRARVEAIGQAEPAATRRPQPPPIATPEQARAAMAQHHSQRKAAAALHISRAQLRRLLGEDI